MGTKCRLPKKCRHELVPVDLMNSSPHRSSSLPGHEGLRLLLKDPILPGRGHILRGLPVQFHQDVKFPMRLEINLRNKWNEAKAEWNKLIDEPIS